jgi:hypothetical protein
MIDALDRYQKPLHRTASPTLETHAHRRHCFCAGWGVPASRGETCACLSKLVAGTLSPKLVASCEDFLALSLSVVCLASSESGAKDTRSPDASRRPRASSKFAQRLECDRIHHRFSPAQSRVARQLARFPRAEILPPINPLALFIRWQTEKLHRFCTIVALKTAFLGRRYLTLNDLRKDHSTMVQFCDPLTGPGENVNSVKKW